MTDTIEWWGLALSAFAALGVLYLIAQTLFDAVPWLSYRLWVEPSGHGRDERVQVTMHGTGQGPGTKHYGVNFGLWNRTSRTAKFQVSMAVPTARNETHGFRPPTTMSAWRGFANLRLLDTTSIQTLDPLGFEVGEGNGRQLFLEGGLRPGDSEPLVIEFTLKDDRIGRRNWSRSYDLLVPMVDFSPPHSTGPAREATTPPAE